jgi:hypothetical protein
MSFSPPLKAKGSLKLWRGSARSLTCFDSYARAVGMDSLGSDRPLDPSDKILFWYRPAAAAKYRALYADQHWADLTTDQLPEVPKP